MKLDCDFSVMPDPKDYDKIHIIVDVSIPRGLIYQILVGIGVIELNPNRMLTKENEKGEKE